MLAEAARSHGGSGTRPNAAVAGTSVAFTGEGACARMLHGALAEDGAHVVQLIVPGGIEPGHPTHDPDVLAGRLWPMHTERQVRRPLRRRSGTDESRLTHHDGRVRR